MRHRTIRPSRRASERRIVRAASHSRSGGASLSRRYATRIDGFANQWSRSGMRLRQHVTAMKTPGGPNASRRDLRTRMVGHFTRHPAVARQACPRCATGHSRGRRGEMIRHACRVGPCPAGGLRCATKRLCTAGIADSARLWCTARQGQARWLAMTRQAGAARSMATQNASDRRNPIIIPSVIRHLIAPHVPRAASALGIQRRLPGAEGVAITFDDGPHPEGTPAILAILAAADIKATFFLVGEQVERRPALAAEIAGQGHLVALHGYRHRPQPAMTKKDVQQDLERGADAIHSATHAQPAWHRPPYGVYSAAGLAAARARALRPLLWSRWGKDWRRFTTPERGSPPGPPQMLRPRRRDPPARCGFLLVPRLPRAHRPGAGTDRERTQTPENRYRPPCLTGLPERTRT